MPITLRTTEMAYRDNSGQYVGINGVSERTTAEQIAAVEAAGEHVLEDVIPHDWTELTEDFDDIKEKIVMSSTTEPDEENNRIWLKPMDSETAIPTYEEFEEVKSAIDDVVTVISSANIANPDVESGNISSTGELTDSTSYYRSKDFVKAKPNTVYTKKNIVNIAEYNENKVFIQRTAPGSGTQQFTTTANTRYFKFTSNSTPVTGWRCNEGSNLVDEDYTPTVYKLNEIVSIEKQIDDTLSKEGFAADAKTVGDELNQIKYYKNSPYYRSGLDLKNNFCSLWYAGAGSEYNQLAFDEDTKYSYVLTAFDGLVSYDSQYAEKNALGTASGVDENDNEYTVYEYVFKAHKYASNDLKTDADLLEIPVILLDGCIHGFEKNSCYGLYYFIRDVLMNYEQSPFLSYIRNNITIKVIPVVCPWGFDNNEYYNANDVNLNRNFNTTGWYEEDHTGAEPFDQPESAIVRDWVLANTSKALFYFNLHTNGHYYASGYNNTACFMPKFSVTNGDKYFNKIALAIQRAVQQITDHFPDEFTLSPTAGEFISRYQTESSKPGIASLWATETAKQLSMTLEGVNGLTVNGVHVFEFLEAPVKKAFSECLGNMIRELIVEYGIFSAI